MLSGGCQTTVRSSGAETLGGEVAVPPRYAAGSASSYVPAVAMHDSAGRHQAEEAHGAVAVGPRQVPAPGLNTTMPIRTPTPRGNVHGRQAVS